jgi:hypothetical protein
MNRTLVFLLGACLFAASCAAAGSQPLILPGAQFPEGPAGGPPAAGPAPARAAPAKAVSDTAILGRDLRLRGSRGTLRLDRAGRSGGIQARLVLEGTRLSEPSQACTVRFEEPVPVAILGREEGLARYGLEAPSCPLLGELVDGGIWVREGRCRIEAQDCAVAAEGLWGPDPATLKSRARDIEQDRGRADRAVRDNYKALTQRAQPQDMRAIVAEQAAFSAEREMACRSYAQEAEHGFCNARFTEARAARLAARLGVAPVEKPDATGSAARAASNARRKMPIKPPPASLLPSPR